MKYQAIIVNDPSKPKQNGSIRLMCFSDTHGHHLEIPKSQIFPSDILICGGDFTIFGNPEHVESFKQWIYGLPCNNKIIIAGNLDLTFDTKKLDHFRNVINQKDPNIKLPENLESVKKSFVESNGKYDYIEDQIIDVNGIRIYGAPFTAEFMDWAFQFEGDEGKNKWNKLTQLLNNKESVDIILTHGPPKGVCDQDHTGQNVGDEDLRKIIEQLQPSLSLFGHIHQAHGNAMVGKTLCCNIAVVNNCREITYAPTYIDLIPV